MLAVRKSAGIAILNPTRTAILLVRCAVSGKWSIPKGGVEHDDSSVLATAIREVKEETGLAAGDHYRFPEESTSFEHLFGNGNTINFFYSVAETESSLTPVNPAEIAEVAWIPINKLRKKIKMMNRPTRIFLQKNRLFAGKRNPPMLW